MEEMMREYERALLKLCRRREEVCRKIGDFGRRLAVLDEEIDELQESIMYMRPYVGRCDKT